MPDEHDAENGLTPNELRLAELLDRDRPMPAAGFRGALGRRLAALDPGWGPRPARLGQIAAAYLMAGLVMIGVAAVIGIGAL
jgi:hypothetical protein